jgi:hypothetical protein
MRVKIHLLFNKCFSVTNKSTLLAHELNVTAFVLVDKSTRCSNKTTAFFTKQG